MTRTSHYLLAVIAAIVAGCSGISGDDCHPRKLVRLDECHGEDRTFQECLFYFRAVGVPQEQWCAAMMARPSNIGEGAACDFERPETWQEVQCSRYGIPTGVRCFTCNVSKPEAAKTYVYAYEQGCSFAVEQVTCNVDPFEAGRKLRDRAERRR